MVVSVGSVGFRIGSDRHQLIQMTFVEWEDYDARQISGGSLPAAGHVNCTQRKHRMQKRFPTTWRPGEIWQRARLALSSHS